MALSNPHRYIRLYLTLQFIYFSTLPSPSPSSSFPPPPTDRVEGGGGEGGREGESKREENIREKKKSSRVSTTLKLPPPPPPPSFPPSFQFSTPAGLHLPTARPRCISHPNNPNQIQSKTAKIQKLMSNEWRWQHMSTHQPPTSHQIPAPFPLFKMNKSMEWGREVET